MMQETPRSEGANVVFECAGFLSATPKSLGDCRHSSTFVEVGRFVDMGPIDCNINLAADAQKPVPGGHRGFTDQPLRASTAYLRAWRIVPSGWSHSRNGKGAG